MRVNKGYILQKQQDKVLLFDSETSELITLNKTAAFIFEKLKKGRDTETIVHDLVETFEVDEAQARSDANHLLKQLLREKILIQ